uniref:Uncharacterized protein n=1 Tax=Anguilla anguilla TaxID=7936 RepID=A0A0E9UKZ4_ANGAN
MHLNPNLQPLRVPSEISHLRHTNRL